MGSVEGLEDTRSAPLRGIVASKIGIGKQTEFKLVRSIADEANLSPGY